MVLRALRRAKGTGHKWCHWPVDIVMAWEREAISHEHWFPGDSVHHFETSRLGYSGQSRPTGHDLVWPFSALSIMALTCSGVNRCMSFRALGARLGSSSGEPALLTWICQRVSKQFMVKM